jgi:dipeptidyl aminopeptidase/acylaminoacyl peptidase
VVIKIIRSTLLLSLFVSYFSIASEQKNNVKESELSAKKLTIETLFKTNDYRNVSLSPDGKHLALIRNHNDVPVIVIVDTKTMKAVNQIYFAKKDRVGNYSWANNERLLIFLASEQRSEERKAYYGEIYSINIDDEKGEFIFGLRSLFHRGKLRSNVTEADLEKHLAHPNIISILEDDPRHIIISTSQYDSEGMWAFKLNIYKGTLETLAKVDGYKVDHDSTRLWYLEKDESLWMSSIDRDNEVTVASYDFNKNSWNKYAIPGVTYNFKIISLYTDKKQLLVRDYCGNDTLSICLFNPATQKLSSLYHIEGANVGTLYTDNDKPYAMSYFNEYPQYKILDETHPAAIEFTAFIKRFAGYNMDVEWDRTVNEKALITLTSDVQPRVWYLFDAKDKKFNFVAKSKKELDINLLNPQYSFKFDARDNTPVQGYLTLPRSNTNTPKPAVILVHGGPHIRDYWGFDSEAQLLSSQGYAVVQINFRGSKGFGWKFESAGFKQWGENIQYDIIDGVNHLVNKGYIDKNRLCIMGASFGAYSALQSSILAPDLFKCAIASMGVYDLELLVDDSEFKDTRFFTERVGAQNIQIKHSPIHAIDKLKLPLLLSHGSKDDRTPLQQAEVLIEQLDKYNKNYEWFEFENEGHGFFNKKNSYTFYENVTRFLEKHNPVDH